MHAYNNSNVHQNYKSIYFLFQKLQIEFVVRKDNLSFKVFVIKDEIF